MVNPILNWTDDDFNSHARVGRDANRAVDPDVSPDFNSHARVGRDCKGNGRAVGIKNFNSHARVGRDEVCKAFRAKGHISTHTPV